MKIPVYYVSLKLSLCCERLRPVNNHHNNEGTENKHSALACIELISLRDSSIAITMCVYVELKCDVQSECSVRKVPKTRCSDVVKLHFPGEKLKYFKKKD